MDEKLKQLLLIDLCARLPHGVKVKVRLHRNDPTSEETLVLNGFNGSDRFKLWVHDPEKLSKYGCCGHGFYVSEVKPYLRPLSSMTEEEKDKIFDVYENNPITELSSKITDLLNKWHLDHHHLIEKGLALPAPDDMYNIKIV